MGLSVNQEVFATRDIIQDASGDWPRQTLARRGEKLIIRSLGNQFYWAYVSHPEITDNSFGVYPSEITTIQPGKR